MNYEEARISLGSYAGRLDVQCRRYRLAVGLTNTEKEAGQTEPRATGLMRQIATDLRVRQKEAVVFGIVINEAIVEDVVGLVQSPLKCAELLKANNRFFSSTQQAAEILQKHPDEEVGEDRPATESELTAAAVQALQEWLATVRPKSVEAATDEPLAGILTGLV